MIVAARRQAVRRWRQDGVPPGAAAALPLGAAVRRYWEVALSVRQAADPAEPEPRPAGRRAMAAWALAAWALSAWALSGPAAAEAVAERTGRGTAVRAAPAHAAAGDRRSVLAERIAAEPVAAMAAASPAAPRRDLSRAVCRAAPVLRDWVAGRCRAYRQTYSRRAADSRKGADGLDRRRRAVDRSNSPPSPRLPCAHDPRRQQGRPR